MLATTSCLEPYPVYNVKPCQENHSWSDIVAEILATMSGGNQDAGNTVTSWSKSWLQHKTFARISFFAEISTAKSRCNHYAGNNATPWLKYWLQRTLSCFDQNLGHNVKSWRRYDSWSEIVSGISATKPHHNQDASNSATLRLKFWSQCQTLSRKSPLIWY